MGGSSKCWEYVKCTAKDAKELCCQKAIEYYRNRIANNQFRMFAAPVKLAHRLKVVEYDTETHKAKKDGIKFNLVRGYTKYTFFGGRTKMDEWYDAEDIKPKTQKATA